MKRNFRLIIPLSTSFIFTICKNGDDGPEPTPEEMQIQRLTGAWVAGENGTVIGLSGDNHFELRKQ